MYHKLNPAVSKDDTFYPYECAFNFEAMSKKIKTKDNEKK